VNFLDSWKIALSAIASVKRLCRSNKNNKLHTNLNYNLIKLKKKQKKERQKRRDKKRKLSILSLWAGKKMVGLIYLDMLLGRLLCLLASLRTIIGIVFYTVDI
jgi:hypothetical protein